MESASTNFSSFGIGLGALALMLALVHFWAGPFEPQPSLETAIADKVASIRSATLSALKGEEFEAKKSMPAWNRDRIAYVSTAVLGGLAFILGVIALARSEKKRAAVGAMLLGASAIAFQFFAMLAMVVLFVVLIGVVLSELGFDLG